MRAMRGPYTPTYAVDLDALAAVWGGGKIAPVEDWHRLLTTSQRNLLDGDFKGMEAVLRSVAAGDRQLARNAGSDFAVNVGHALELWASWLGRPVDFLLDGHRWRKADSEVETLEWLSHRGVDIGVGYGVSPWPVPVTKEPELVRTIRSSQVRTLVEQMKSVAQDVPLMMWREHKALLAVFEQRARDATDLVEISWF